MRRFQDAHAQKLVVLYHPVVKKYSETLSQRAMNQDLSI